MKRRLFNLAAVVSLLLFVGTVAVWTRSYWNGYELCYHRGERLYEARATCGSFFISASQYQTVPQLLSFYSDPVNIMRADRLWRPRVERWQDGWELGVPGWIVCGACLLVSAFVIYRWRPTGVGNQCRICGYDLRESPNRCPECGTPRPAAT
jgi:hypothetical protein